MFQLILLSQWMVNENVKVLLAIIRRLTVCSNNLNVDDVWIWCHLSNDFVDRIDVLWINMLSIFSA